MKLIYNKIAFEKKSLLGTYIHYYILNAMRYKSQSVVAEFKLIDLALITRSLLRIFHQVPHQMA